MPIDASIPFRALATVPLMTPQEHQENALARQMRQMQMQGMQMDMQEKQQQREQKNALAAALKGVKPGDYNALANAYAQYDPEQATRYAELGQKQLAAQQEQEQKQRERVKKALIYADTPEAWDQQIEMLEAEGMPGVGDFRGKFSQQTRMALAAQVDPSLLKADLKQVDLGGKVQWVDVNPFTNPSVRGTRLDKTLTPGERANQALGYARLNQSASQFQQSQATQRMALGKPPSGYRYKADGTLEAIPGGPAAGQANSQSKIQTDANDLLELIKDATPLVGRATGSYAGAGVDAAARFFGKSTPGADNAAKLQALEGAMMAKIPKMSGPQSDKDVALYKQMVGRIGDPTIPSSQKKAALDTIKKIQQKYAGKTSAPAAKAKFLGFE